MYLFTSSLATCGVCLCLDVYACIHANGRIDNWWINTRAINSFSTSDPKGSESHQPACAWSRKQSRKVKSSRLLVSATNNVRCVHERKEICRICTWVVRRSDIKEKTITRVCFALNEYQPISAIWNYYKQIFDIFFLLAIVFFFQRNHQFCSCA